MRTHPPPLPIASFWPPLLPVSHRNPARCVRPPPLSPAHSVLCGMRTHPPPPPTLPLLSPDANAAADPDCCLLCRPYRCFCAAPGAGFHLLPPTPNPSHLTAPYRCFCAAPTPVFARQHLPLLSAPDAGLSSGSTCVMGRCPPACIQLYNNISM
ncbi:hypothetical protein B0H19DRAFT_1152953 [Mycena capillaripes]|nr:hypothetical protein B0H19DRAFT_1152953 [Mycena capillaripes]